MGVYGYYRNASYYLFVDIAPAAVKKGDEKDSANARNSLIEQVGLSESVLIIM